MTIDRDLLSQLSAQTLSEPTGVEALICGIHRRPGLREWVTLESVALAPVPIKRGERWRILTLLAVPIQLKNEFLGFNPPWGAIEWVWPEQVVAQTIHLHWYEETAALRQSGVITASPADTRVKLEIQEQTRRQKALFLVLDQFLSSNPDQQANLSSLAPHYAGLLPEAVYPYYWALIPSSKQWLRPDVSAFVLTSPQLNSESSTQNQKAKVSVPAKLVAEEPSFQESITSLLELTSPTDLTKQVESWLHQGLMLAEAQELQEVVTDLQALENRLRLPGFRLAFVGEFSRGKSTLINRLLEQPLLPVGNLPITATLISIVPGLEDSMEVRFPQRLPEVRPLQKDSWQDLLVDEATANNQDVLAQVRLTLSHPWLQKIDVELIDTPGAGDLTSRRAAQIFGLLSQCDAAVMLVSGTLPLSLTEVAFLEQEVIGRNVPRVLVVVSKLDTISEEERISVLADIRERIARVSAKIPVLPLHPVDKARSEAQALEAVQTQIEMMVVKGERRVWRSRQVAGQLAQRLEQLIEIGKAKIAIAQMSVAEREKASRQAQAAIQEAQLGWEQIRLKLDQRRLRCYQNLQPRIVSAKTDLLERLTFELNRTPNPKTWWEQDLPFRLRRELVVISRKLENLLMKELAQDIEWLQEEVSTTFPTQTYRSTVDASATEEILPSFRDLSLADVRQYRLLTRIGSSGAMISSYVLGGPIGIVTSTVVWILGEQIINKEVEEQRNLLTQELRCVIDKAIDEYCRGIGESLRQLYNQLAEETKQEQIVWQQSKTIAIQTDELNQNEQVWEQMINDAFNLKTEIIQALKK
ncbi:MAG: dynamin family protein [Coleofasciculaceae cyanobacterium]